MTSHVDSLQRRSMTCKEVHAHHGWVQKKAIPYCTWTAVAWQGPLLFLTPSLWNFQPTSNSWHLSGTWCTVVEIPGLKRRTTLKDIEPVGVLLPIELVIASCYGRTSQGWPQRLGTCPVSSMPWSARSCVMHAKLPQRHGQVKVREGKISNAWHIL